MFVFFFILSMVSCSSEPDCIETKIAEFQTQQADCTGASVIKYEFNGKTLYGFSDGQCIADGGISLFDKNCVSVCFIGGIAALTDCEGINFFQNAEEIEKIWEER